MRNYDGTSSGEFVNYLNSDTALPIHYTPLPSCAAECDGVWVLQEPPEVIEETKVLATTD